MNEYQGGKAVIYARYSSHNQTEQSIEGQLHDAYRFAENNGITIVNEYIDRAMTGTKDDRPAFQKMMRDAEKKQFMIVLVWKLDRFARNRYDSATYRALLRRSGVKVVSVMENISDTPEGIIMEGLLESMAEYYSASLSENIKRGINEMVRKGWFKGGPVAYGYIHRDHHLVPNPETVPIVKEIFERYADGEGPGYIANDLNNRGIRNSNGMPFSITGIGRIITNRTYIGEYYCKDTLVEGCAEPIIDRELFDRAAEHRERRRRAPAANRTPNVRYMLTGKLRCGECGSNMTGHNGTSKTGVLHYYYKCNIASHGGGRCLKKAVRKEEIEYIVCKIVSDYILNKKAETLEYIADSFMEIYLAENNDADLKEMETQLRRIDRDLEKLVDSLIQMPESARPRIAERMDLLETQRTDLESKLAKRRIETSNHYCREDFVNSVHKMMLDLDNDDNKIFIIEKFVNCVYLYEDGRIVIYFKRFPGMPYVYEDEENCITKDSYTEVKDVFRGGDPPELAFLPNFRLGSTLITYAPPQASKGELGKPHLFFLHGRMGIMAWMRYKQSPRNLVGYFR